MGVGVYVSVGLKSIFCEVRKLGSRAVRRIKNNLMSPEMLD